MNYTRLLLMSVLLISCRNRQKIKAPDISKVKLALPVASFEGDFFTLDTNHLDSGLSELKKKYGVFYDDYMFSIAAFSPSQADLKQQIVPFIRKYKGLSDSIALYFPDLSVVLKQVENGLKRMKVYFPELATPDHIITYIGPIDSYGAFADKGNIAIGLQQFLGPRYSGYQSEYIENLFGKQRIDCFSTAYIPVTALATWINHQFPAKAGEMRLIDKIIEEGRKVYLLQQLLPETPDDVLLGYSQTQMKWCGDHQHEILDYFEKNDLFKSRDPEQIIQYTSDQVTAPDLPENYPNNIGKFIGFLLVNNYMKRHKDVTPEMLFNLNAGQIYLPNKH